MSRCSVSEIFQQELILVSFRDFKCSKAVFWTFLFHIRGHCNRYVPYLLKDNARTLESREKASTVWPNGMSHKKWRETKQQLIWLPDLALLGCCLVSLHFLCDIPFGHAVVMVQVHFNFMLDSTNFCRYWSDILTKSSYWISLSESEPIPWEGKSFRFGFE